MHHFVRVADVADVPDPGSLVVEVDGDPIALFRVDGAFHAIDDVCTHDGGPLASGELVGHKVACPRHGARFDVRTGAALSMPAVRGTRSHDVKVEDGGVWIRLCEGHGTSGPVAQSPSGARSLPVTAAPSPSAPLVTPTPIAGDVTAGQAPAAAIDPAASGPLCEERARELLKAVKDPELFVNIVDLGLIYGVTITPSTDQPGKQHVAVDMTMTSPACPAGPQLIADTKRTLAVVPDVAAVEVRIVMDPPWTPDRMTDDARDQLGIF